MSCWESWKWHFWDPKFKNFLWEHSPRPPRLGRLRRYKFSSLHVCTNKISCYTPASEYILIAGTWNFVKRGAGCGDGDRKECWYKLTKNDWQERLTTCSQEELNILISQKKPWDPFTIKPILSKALHVFSGHLPKFQKLTCHLFLHVGPIKLFSCLVLSLNGHFDKTYHTSATDTVCMVFSFYFLCFIQEEEEALSGHFVLR